MATRRAANTRALAAQRRRAAGRARPDPQNRPTDGVSARFALVGKDPTKHYVWVPKNGDLHAVPHYEMMGYKPEVWTKDGVQPKLCASKDIGSVIETRELVLMSISMREHQDIVDYGADGASGLRWADQIENAMVHGTGRDALQDHPGYGEYLDVAEGVKPLEEVRRNG